MNKFFIVLSFMLLILSQTPMAFADIAVAEIKSTQEGSSVAGKVTFEETKDGLKVDAQVTGASEGNHGFHIHEKGDCGDSGKAAGAHFNPDQLPHGDVLKQGLSYTHAGDLGNIQIDASGKGELHTVVSGLTLHEGKYDVAGRAVILHEKEDDFSQPAGNAGSRIGCGEIVVQKA